MLGKPTGRGGQRLFIVPRKLQATARAAGGNAEPTLVEPGAGSRELIAKGWELGANFLKGGSLRGRPMRIDQKGIAAMRLGTPGGRDERL